MALFLSDVLWLVSSWETGLGAFWRFLKCFWGGLRGTMGFGDLPDGQKLVLSCVFFRVSLS